MQDSVKNQVQAYLACSASLKGRIREMEVDELTELLTTVEDPTLIQYITEQLRQIKGQ